MEIPQDYRPLGCGECAAGAGLGFEFTMAFQPIVSTSSRDVFAQEALVRGPGDDTAGPIFARVNDSNRYRFDQACRVKAIELAAELDIRCLLGVNFMPKAVYRPELCIRTTIEAAERCGIPLNRIILEVTESEKVEDHAHLRGIVEHYKARGILTAIDDFGAGHAGLTLLAEFPTDFVKLDIALVRNLDKDRARRAIAKGVVQVCNELSARIIAEGVESYAEVSALRDLGVELFQGYHFARPSFRTLGTVRPEAYNPPRLSAG